MSLSYTSYVFIGTEISDRHFFTEGNSIYCCYRHGKKNGKFCGDCGKKCSKETEKIWTLQMKKAAAIYNTTPAELWDEITGEGGGHCFPSDTLVGVWTFGYENEEILFGTVVAKAEDSSYRKSSNSHILHDDFIHRFTEVTGAFSAFGIEKTVAIMAVQDCG